jgi:NAD(P)H-hydrate epimerase
MQRTDKNIVKKAVVLRADDAHKGNMGSMLSICGCYGMAGASILSGKSALRCGLGLLKMAVVKSIYPITAQAILESVFLPLDETDCGKIKKSNIPYLLEQAQKSTSVLIGCGISVCEDTTELVKAFILNCKTPLVLDADALNCIADEPNILKLAKAPIIITPHPAEMGRLVGASATQINSDRLNYAKNFSEQNNVVTVLKGAGTLITSPNGKALINHTGNSGMATGGSGDVLAGMIASILAQGADAFDSASAGVYLHGLAGDIAKNKLGKISMLPTDLIDCISLAYKECGFDN